MISHDSNPRCVGGGTDWGNIVAGGRIRHMTKPPSPTSTRPGAEAAYLEHRKAVGHAMSAGVPSRASGICPRSAERASGVIALVISVSMNPGAIALHRMLREASSFATDLVSPIRPALLAA